LRWFEGLISQGALKGFDRMSERLRDHPVILYLAFVLPVLMLVCAAILGASVFVFLVILVWIGVSLMVLVLPVSNDSGMSQ